MLARVLNLPGAPVLGGGVAAAEGHLPALRDPRVQVRGAIAVLAAVAIPLVLLTVEPHLGPGIRYADVLALCICFAAFVLAALVVPWQRLEQFWLLYLVGVPIVFVAALNSLAGAGQSPYFVIYAPILAIAGWYLTPRQTTVVIGLVVATELWRAAALDHSGSIDHLAIGLPFMVVIAATASVTSHWLRVALAETRLAQRRMADTLDAIRRLGREPSVGVLAQLERAAARIFDAETTVIRIGADKPPEVHLAPAIVDDRAATVIVPGAVRLHALLRIEGRQALSAQDLRLAAVLSEAAGRTLDAHAQAPAGHIDDDRDSLTGLPNRRALERDLAAALTAANHATAAQPALVFVDVDDLGGFNDAHGHAAGDAVLARLAAVVLSSLDHAERAYRFAGDEFAILLADGGRERAAAVAQRIREGAATAGNDGDGRPLPRFKISVGLAVPSSAGTAPADLLAAADRRVHESKTPDGTDESGE